MSAKVGRFLGFFAERELVHYIVDLIQSENGQSSGSFRNDQIMNEPCTADWRGNKYICFGVVTMDRLDMKH